MNDDTQTSKKSLEDQKIFDICRDIELKNAELYEYFGEVFQNDAEVSRLWFKTAEEERNHAAQFSLAAKLHTGITASSVDPWKAANTLKIVNSIFENVRGHRPTLLDALRSAMKLEENLSVFHLHCVGLFADESVKKMFDAMMKVDDAHVVKLKALHEKVLAKR